MKAAVTRGEGDIAVAEAPAPETGEYRCLCRILACASCSGTDVKIINRKLPFEVPYPSVFGHESFGTVVKKGSKARHVNEGDLFLRPAACYPGEQIGDYFSSWGGFAEYGLVTDVKAFREDNPEAELPPYTKYQQKVPGDIDISPANATMLVTLKEAASFVSNIRVHLNSSVLILGTGPVGKAMCFFSKLAGANPVIIAGRRKEALGWAEEAGADFTADTRKHGLEKSIKDFTSGKGVDFILDTTGAPELVLSLAGCLSARGKTAPYATYPEPGPFNGEAKDGFIFSGPSEEAAHEYLLYLVRKKIADLSMFYTHELPFGSIKEGFELIEDRKAGKIVFTMEGGNL